MCCWAVGPSRSGGFRWGEWKPVPAMAGCCRFGKPFSCQHSVQDGAIVRGLPGRDDDEDVRVVREAAQEDVELRRLGVHHQEPGRRRRGMCVPGGAVLERLEDVREALVPVVDRVHVADVGGDGGDSEEGRPFKENDLLRIDPLREGSQEALNDGEIGDELVDDPRPRLVERLVPDAAPKGIDFEVLRATPDEGRPFLVDPLAVLSLDQIELVDEAENVCVRAVLFQGVNYGVVGVEVALDLARFDIEDVDKNRDVREDVAALGGQVRFHECILPLQVFRELSVIRPSI